MMGEEHLNFMKEIPFIRNQSIDFQSKSMEWFLYDRDPRHERINALLLVCIHRDIFLGYDKIIDISASKYPRRMLLTNPLSETKLLKRLTLEKHITLIQIFAFLVQKFLFCFNYTFFFIAGLSLQSCLSFQGFRGSKLLKVCLVV